MPLVPRPLTNWQSAQAARASARPTLERSWPSFLPSPDDVRASLPRVSLRSPGARQPAPARLGLGAPGTAPTGAPSMGQGRSSIFMTPSF